MHYYAVNYFHKNHLHNVGLVTYYILVKLSLAAKVKVQCILMVGLALLLYKYSS